jgi:hypothetical protein
MPTIWNYIRQEGLLYRSGNGGIYLAIRRLNGQNEIRIEGEVQHEPDFNEIVGITSKFLYEGKAPQNGALAFLVPFFRKDNSAHYLVVVYEIGKLVQQVGDAQASNSGLFREYAVNQTFEQLARTPNPNTPETVQAAAAIGMIEGDPATVMRRYIIDLPTWPPGSVTYTQTEKGKAEVRQTRVLRTVIYRDDLAVVIFQQAGNLLNAVHGRRGEQWKIFAEANMPFAGTRHHDERPANELAEFQPRHESCGQRRDGRV